MVGTGVRGHKKAENPRFEGEDSGLEVTEENRKRSKHERGIRIRTKENVK